MELTDHYLLHHSGRWWLVSTQPGSSRTISL